MLPPFKPFFFALLMIFNANVYSLELGLGVGIASGGDTLILFDDGTTFDAGDGVTIALEARQNLGGSMSIKSALGYKFKSEDFFSSQGTASLSVNSIPFSAGIEYRLSPKFAIELGGTSNINYFWETEISSSTSITQFSSNVGKYFELIYSSNTKSDLVLRIVNGALVTSDSTNATFDASHIAIFARSYF